MRNLLRNAGLIITMGMVLCTQSARVFADDIRIYLDNKPIKLEQKAFNQDGRILVPLRGICENMGVSVEWDEMTRQVKLQRDFTDCTFTIDKDCVIINNELKTIDVVPQIIDQRTYVPLRAVQEALGDKVEWDGGLNSVYITRKDKSYINGNSNKIVDLVKKYSKEIDGEDCAIIDVVVPQILNPSNMVAIDKINEYYKETGSEYFSKFKEMIEEDQEAVMRNWDINKIPFGYQLSYNVGHNANDILSVRNKTYMNAGGAHPSWSISCDIFDTKTGNRLEPTDILKGTKEEIQQFIIDGFTKLIDEEPNRYFETAKEDLKEYIKDVDFYIDDGKLVFMFNHYIIAPYAGGICEFEVDIKENQDMFKIDLVDTNNYNEQKDILKVASDYNRCDIKLIDKTILGNDKCYVFQKEESRDVMAIDVSGKNVYILEESDNMYKILDTKRINNVITNEDALKLVIDKIDSSEYSYEIGGYLLEDGNEYIIVVTQDIEEKTTSKLLVNKKTGEIATYYFE